MKIYIQSQIDLITNSSTEIFQIANSRSIEDLKEMIDAILEIGGSTEKCSDLFEISLEYSPDDYFVEEFLEGDSVKDDEEVKEYIKTSWIEDSKDILRNKLTAKYKEELDDYVIRETNRRIDYADGGIPDRLIRITTKCLNKDYSKIFDCINHLFEYHETHC